MPLSMFSDLQSIGDFVWLLQANTCSSDSSAYCRSLSSRNSTPIGLLEFLPEGVAGLLDGLMAWQLIGEAQET